MAIRKIINSEDPKYLEKITSEIVFDTVPTVNSFNAITSDGVARAVAGASGEVPQVTENDNGKVLKAVYDAGGPAVEWGVDQTGPTYTAGDGISITNGAISANVDGTTIQVNASGELEATAPTFTAGDGISISNGEISASVDGTTIQVNSDGELEAIGGSGSSGYTPVNLDPITEGPYTIPVGNREDVYVQISGFASSTTLAIQLENDCTDAIVTVNAVGANTLSGIQVSRGNTTLEIYGTSTVVNVSSLPYANNGRVLLTTVDGDSAYEPPSDFSEIEVENADTIIGSVDATDASQALRGRFSIEIKGRCAILHKP